MVKIAIILLFVLSIFMFTGCSEEIDNVQKEHNYITAGQQQKGTDIFYDYSEDNISKMILRTYSTTCYELADEESIETVKETLFNSEYIEIENPWLEGGIFLEIYVNDKMYELTINKDVICSENKTYQILDESLYEQILKTFMDCGTKTE